MRKGFKVESVSDERRNHKCIMNFNNERKERMKKKRKIEPETDRIGEMKG